ncbi:MAG: hypothetical protein PHT55_02485, partial [Spirochaetales bacterium]|nr:hypothetical protein [Spirochaetales bacterium]
MKLQRRNSLFPIMAALALFAMMAAFYSCDNTFHVFDDIQTEVKQVGTDIFKNATVKALGDDGTNYYAAMAKAWYRPIAGGDWKVLPIAGDADYESYSLVSDGSGAVYAVLTKSGSPAIYKGTAAGTTWTPLTLGSLDGLYLDELYFS